MASSGRFPESGTCPLLEGIVVDFRQSARADSRLGARAVIAQFLSRSAVATVGNSSTGTSRWGGTVKRTGSLAAVAEKVSIV